MGDVGGLNDALMTIGSILVWIFQGNSMLEYMVTNIFKVSNSGPTVGSGFNNQVKRSFFSFEKWKTIEKAKCASPLCNFRKRYKLIKIGKCEIQKELDIINYFRKLKKLEILTKILFTKAERYLLNK